MDNNIKKALNEIFTPLLDTAKDKAKATEVLHIICSSFVDFVRHVSILLAANPEKKTLLYREDIVRQRTSDLLKELILETIKDFESQC